MFDFWRSDKSARGIFCGLNPGHSSQWTEDETRAGMERRAQYSTWLTDYMRASDLSDTVEVRNKLVIEEVEVVV